MIRHICMFKLKEENKEENLKHILQKAQELKEIKEIKAFDIVLNSQDAPIQNYDFSLIFDFESIEALNIYQENEIHVRFGNFITPLRDLRACIDYEF